MAQNARDLVGWDLDGHLVQRHCLVVEDLGELLHLDGPLGVVLELHSPVLEEVGDGVLLHPLLVRPERV